MKQNIQNLINQLGRTKLMILGGVLIALMAGFFLLIAMASKPEMSVLYSELDPAEAGQVVSHLESMGLPVQTSADGRRISVPLEAVGRARMALAEQGLPSSGGVGYELFDEDSGLGLTSFMQRVSRLRAMEGELGRTISTLSGVEGARVHLVLPDRETFGRSAPKASASVVVRMQRGYSLEARQASAIRHLIASAVPDLVASDVTLLDAAGETLFASDETSYANSYRDGLKASLEVSLVKSIEDLLAPRLGRGNIKVSVFTDLDMRREVIRSTTYDPQSQVERSVHFIQEKDSSSDGATDLPTTVEQNIPELFVDGGTGETTRQSDSSRLEEITNYEISEERREVLKEPGEIRRIAVAVMVNGIYEQADDGEYFYQDRSEEELERIRGLVKTAIGYDEERGDSVSVESMQFVDFDMASGQEEGSNLMYALVGSIGPIIKWLAILVLGGLIIMFVVRPLIDRLFSRDAKEEAESASAELAAARDDTAAREDREVVLTVAEQDEAVKGLLKAAEEEPEITLSIIRDFIQE